MISISPVTDKELLSDLYNKNNIEPNINSSAVAAMFSNECLGYCLFDLDEKSIIIRFLFPQDDLMLADGILRSALHVAAERSAMNAFYSDTVSEETLEKLQFISDKDNKKLDIDKLFGGCCCSQN